jgi:hypothetical protein
VSASGAREEPDGTKWRETGGACGGRPQSGSRTRGQTVALLLRNGAGMVATLDEVRDDGIVLSEVEKLGPGPTIYCPWDSLRRLQDRPTFFMPPHEEPESHEYYELYELREVPPEEIEPEPYLERRRASAQNLERVVPVAQRRTVGEVTVALTSLEPFGEEVGVLRYRIFCEAGMFEGEIPMPELVVRDESGREPPWSLQGSSRSTDEADGEVEVRDLPETGELEVEVARLVSLAFGEEAGEEVVEDSHDGPWTFRFAI